MTNYQDSISWLAEQTLEKWKKDLVGWKGAIGGEINAIAFIYNKTPYEVNQDVWDEIIGVFGDPINS